MPVQIFYGAYTQCILLVCKALKLLNSLCFECLSMSVMGFQKKFGWEVHGWVGSIFYLVFF